MRRRILLAVFALAVAPACFDDKGNVVIDLDTPPNPSLEVVPDELRFTHLVGRSDCPQPIGRVRVRHRGEGTFVYRVTVAAPLALRVEGGFTRSRDIAVGRGDGEDIEVVFDCSSQASPVVQTVTFRDRTDAARGSFGVNGTVVQ